MKILNLYAGIGGNRKLWKDVEVTAVEYREDIAAVYRHYFPQDEVVVADAHEYLLKHYKEFDFIWSSPPCPTHSRSRLAGYKNSDKVQAQYPDMKLWQEIIFLRHHHKGLWCVENVDPYYDTPVVPYFKLGRHLFWANFFIHKIEIQEADINRGTRADYKKLHGFDLSQFKMKTRTDQIYRNCVHPDTGLHVLNCAIDKMNRPDKYQMQLPLIA